MTNPNVPSIDVIAQKAVDILLQSGNHQPFLFIFTMSDSMVAPLAFIPETTEEKSLMMKFIAQEARKQSQNTVLTDIFMVTEAWMLNTEKSAEDLGDTRISEHPDRVEILAVTQFNVRQNKAGMRIYEMKRDAKGELVEIVANATAGGDLQEVRSYLLEAFVAGWDALPLS
jgi:hypothetical protein